MYQKHQSNTSYEMRDLLSGHPPTSGPATAPEANHGATVLALRPACASWMAIFWFCECAKSTMRFKGSIWLSCQSPLSSGVMRPSGVTEVAAAASEDHLMCWENRLVNTFYHRETWAARNYPAKVSEVPGRMMTVVCRVLAQR